MAKQQRPWDKHEAAILLDAVIRVRSGELERKQAIVEVSDKLRRKAQIAGIEIDNVYRNVAGITFQMHSMESAYVGHTLIKPATKLFSSVVEMMRNCKSEYDSLLREAIELSGANKTLEEKYKKWLSKKVSVAQMSELSAAYTQINDYFLEKKVLRQPLFETTDKRVLAIIQKTIDENRLFRFKHKRQINKMSAAIRYYVKYIKNGRYEDEDIVESPDIKQDVNEHSNDIEIKDTIVQNTDGVETITISADQRKKDFSDWMIKSGMATATVRPYVSSLGLAGEIALENGIISTNVFEITDVEVLKDAISRLMVNPAFLEKNEARHNQFRAAWIKYINYCGDPDFGARDIRTDQSENEQVVTKDSQVLYRRLKSMASVYDDVEGFKTEWIREKLGLSIDIDELEEALDEIPWITEVQDGVYSFSKNAMPMIEFDKESLIKVLMMRYQNGMQFDSIDLEIFRETYSDIIGEELDLTDKELMTCLCKSGVMYKGRIFPAEGIISEDAREKLMDYIESSFSEGKQVLYYKAIYADLSDVFAYCFNLTDAMMLKPYLEHVCNPDDYFFTDEYITKERDVKIDHSVEVEEYLLAAGKPLSYEEVYAGLSHVSKDIIYSVIKTSTDILLNEKEHYFHYGIFEFSSEEADKITDYINCCIEEDGYCIWSSVFEKIRETMPIFIENNVYLSSLGIRNAIAKKLSGRFHFDGEVICHRAEELSMADVYRLYGKNHTPFSDEDLYLFSKEVSGGAIYFDSLSETAARVSKTLFIPRSELSFDIEATDSAIATYLDTGYMLIRDIDSFLVFPNVGYEWNEFLLETYLMYFSRKYALFNNGRSLNNVAGAVVRRGSGYEEFADVCADILAKSGCSLTKNKALEYLGEVNLLTRRSYRKIDSVLVKAKQIRNRKE